MAERSIQETIEKLCELIVFTGINDLQELAQIHTFLIEVRDWAHSSGRVKTAQVAEIVANWIEKIVLQEMPEPEEALRTISEVVSIFQQIILSDISEEEVKFPESILKSIDEYKDKKEEAFELPENVDPVIFHQFLTDQETNLEELEALLLRLGNDFDKETSAEIKRKIHTLKGETGILGLNDVQELCHIAEDRIEQGIDPELVDLLLTLKDWLKAKFDALSGKCTLPPFPYELKKKLLEKQEIGVTVDSEVQKESEKEEGISFAPQKIEGELELVKDFVQEATEHLENCDVHLLTLETEPDNEDAINAIFRAFHTIKGVSGFLGLIEIKQVSHEAENLLDKARKKEILLVGENIDLVFESVDILKDCVDKVRKALTTGELIYPNERSADLIYRIKSILKTPKVIIPTPVEKNVSSKKLGEILVENEIVTPETVERAVVLQNKLKGVQKKIGEVLVEQNVVTSKIIDEALEIKKEVAPDKPIGEILIEGGLAAPEDVEKALEIQKDKEKTTPKLGEILVKMGEVDAKEVAQALRTQRAQALSPTVSVTEAIKVDANRLDLLVDTIGELVIAESMVAREVELQGDLYSDLARHVSQLDKITRELQLMAMSLRMIPIKNTFQKMARLVRDLSKKTGKLIEFHMSGEDTELDKTVVDKIGDPLVHMIRNAVDHGIEDNPEERVKKGKPSIGNIYLRAFHAGGNIHIEVEDDGAGLNREAIIKKAIEKGIIHSDEGLSDKDVWNLIFEPGFSTAKVVTEVSGRGVGMDVVKKNIESLRGQVDIQSTPGKGTKFTIRLPLTLAIIDGMVVRVGSERYIIPTLSIVISLRPNTTDIYSVVGRGEVLNFHGKLINLYKLYQIFDIPNAITDYKDGTVIVVETGNTQVGILVDEILGQQQIVIKSLGEALKGLPGIAGGAIMSDGKVGLILDIPGVVKLAESVCMF